MDGLDANASAQQFICRDRRIDAAAEKMHDLAIHPKRIAAKARVFVARQICIVVADGNFQ